MFYNIGTWRVLKYSRAPVNEERSGFGDQRLIKHSSPNFLRFSVWLSDIITLIRQKDRQTERQTDGQSDNTDRQDRQTGRQADRQTGRQADRQTGTQGDN
jgi:hypothetical protein